MGLNQPGDGFRGQEHGRRSCVWRDHVTVARNKIDYDLDANDGRVPDAPARPKIEENAVINKREEHPPSRRTVNGK